MAKKLKGVWLFPFFSFFNLFVFTDLKAAAADYMQASEEYLYNQIGVREL